VAAAPHAKALLLLSYEVASTSAAVVARVWRRRSASHRRRVMKIWLGRITRPDS
jgi:hypothetical protein